MKLLIDNVIPKGLSDYGSCIMTLSITVHPFTFHLDILSIKFAKNR